MGLCVDQTNNRLFVASYTDHAVMVFDNANSASSLASLSRTMNFGVNVRYVTLDSVNDRLYSTTSAGTFIVNGASTAGGGNSATYVAAPTGSMFGAASVTP
jgi:20S proteasome alpha/beta subunit